MTRGEPVARGAQEKPDLIEGIALAPAVTGRVLLDAAAYLIESVASELDDAKDTSGAGGGLGAGQAMAFLLSLEGIHRRDLDTGAKLFAALF